MDGWLVASSISSPAQRGSASQRWSMISWLRLPAAACGAALIGITHFSKGTDGKNPVDRVNGSLAFGAIARIVLCAGADEDGQQRRLVRASSNIGPMGDGFGYTLSQEPVPGEDFTASRVLWGSRLQGSARELLGDGAKEDKTTAATDFITARLAGGPVLSKDMREAADALGHSWPTVNRARAKMPWVVIKQMTKGQRGEALPEAPEGSFQRGWYWCDDPLLG